jgi:hypothetical protein
LVSSSITFGSFSQEENTRHKEQEAKNKRQETNRVES